MRVHTMTKPIDLAKSYMESFSVRSLWMLWKPYCLMTWFLMARFTSLLQQKNI